MSQGHRTPRTCPMETPYPVALVRQTIAPGAQASQKLNGLSRPVNGRSERTCIEAAETQRLGSPRDRCSGAATALENEILSRHLWSRHSNGVRARCTGSDSPRHRTWLRNVGVAMLLGGAMGRSIGLDPAKFGTHSLRRAKAVPDRCVTHSLRRSSPTCRGRMLCQRASITGHAILKEVRATRHFAPIIRDRRIRRTISYRVASARHASTDPTQQPGLPVAKPMSLSLRCRVVGHHADSQHQDVDALVGQVRKASQS